MAPMLNAAMYAPITSETNLATEYQHVIESLEALETELRIQHFPELVERPPPLEFDDLIHESDGVNSSSDGSDGSNGSGALATISNNGTNGTNGASASLRKRALKSFSLTMFPPVNFDFTQLTSLDVGNNELMDLPGLECMVNLKSLNLQRNWFNTLPSNIGALTHLYELNASRCFLRANESSLRFSELRRLNDLRILDLTYNQKCGKDCHRALIQEEVPQLTEVKLTLWEEMGNVQGSYVGKSAAERDPNLLRSRLEPWGTVNLRRRLVVDFGQMPTDASVVDRAGVMERLLHCYEKEGWMDEHGLDQRTRVRLKGVPVPQNLIEKLLVELRAWTNETGEVAPRRERPSINASNYMILRAPKLEENVIDGVDVVDGEEEQEGQSTRTTRTTRTTQTTRTSRRAKRKAKKLEKYKTIWELALEALNTVDPTFAERCTEIACTFGFRGSPHIDKQNCGPFYGLAMGEFPAGQGGICVESSARMICTMDTRNRLGRVDGRFPHWVDNYDEGSERYSLIYYETGSRFVKPGPAVFDIPDNK